jgi:hypothetical protein
MSGLQFKQKVVVKQKEEPLSSKRAHGIVKDTLLNMEVYQKMVRLIISLDIKQRRKMVGASSPRAA